MNGLYEMQERPVFFRKNEPQINADLIIGHPRSSGALIPVFALFASSAVKSKSAPQRVRRTQRGEQ